jgi:hypothetical protein
MPLFPAQRHAAQRTTSKSVEDGMQSGRNKDYCWRGKDNAGAIVAVEELMGGVGGATPAVLEPRPKS